MTNQTESKLREGGLRRREAFVLLGGAGITGQNLTIGNFGTIEGGLSGDGVTRANAITSTGGNNSLTVQVGSTIIGNVVMGGGGLLAASGLLLLLCVDAEADYVTQLLPALLVFSVGLAATVAPLTATVLADADEEHAGIASGTNNAIARAAGLLGVAAHVDVELPVDLERRRGDRVGAEDAPADKVGGQPLQQPPPELGVGHLTAAEHDGDLDLVALLEEPLDVARQLYDLVDQHVVYKKEGQGWGRGDTNWVCDSGYGNCTDFHSLFISLARSQELPARFEIGFSIPTDKLEGPIAGYHCWAWFYLDRRGWTPVDISEADKHPELKEYYFGNLTENRVAFSKGRDLVLVPKQDFKPLNFLIYPYVEVDGKPHSADRIQKKFTFEDQP